MKKVVIFHSEKIEFEFDADGNTTSVRSRTEYTNSDSNTGIVDVKSWPVDVEDTTLFVYFMNQRRAWDTQLKKYAVED